MSWKVSAQWNTHRSKRRFHQIGENRQMPFVLHFKRSESGMTSHLFFLHLKTLYCATYNEKLNCVSTNKSFDRLWTAFWMLIHSRIQQMTNWQPKSKHGAAVQFIAKTNVNLRLRCKNVSKMYWKQRRSLEHLTIDVGCRSWYFWVEECWFNERCWIKMYRTGLFCLCYKQSDSFFFSSYQSPFSRTFQARHFQWLKKKQEYELYRKGDKFTHLNILFKMIFFGIVFNVCVCVWFFWNRINNGIFCHWIFFQFPNKNKPRMMWNFSRVYYLKFNAVDNQFKQLQGIFDEKKMWMNYIRSE